MKYGEVLNRAFAALKSKPLWGFAATAYAAYILPLLIGVSFFFVTFGSTVGSSLEDMSKLSNTDFAWLFGGVAAAGLGALASFVPMLIFRGGMYHVANAAIAQTPFRMGEGWSVGGRRIGRTLGINLLVGLVIVGVMMVAMIPMIAIILASSVGAESDGAIAGMIVGLLCTVLAFYAFLFVVVLTATAWTSIALGYGIIGGRTAGDAVGSAWKAMRARWKNVVVFLLIVIGISLAYQLVTSFITAPIQFISSMSTLSPRMFTDPGYTPDFGRMYQTMPLLYAVVFVLSFPIVVFMSVAWVAFFRELTGMEAPSQAQPEPAPLAPPQPPMQVAPPEPPTPPATDA